MTTPDRMEMLAAAWDLNRADLVRYARRLLLDPDVADDVVQHAALRAMQATSPPSAALEVRKWLFRITSNLVIDELRRRGIWSETALPDARDDAERDCDFVAASVALRGTQDVDAIAREHLSFCFSCVLRSLPPHRAAALLLAEMYGFTVREAASILGGSQAQVKNWLQEARAALVARHLDRCALVHKRGTCYQCSELAMFFNGAPVDPLEGTEGNIDDRVRVVRASRSDLGVWHRRLLQVIEKRHRTAKEPPAPGEESRS